MTIGRSRNLAEQLDAALDGRATDVPEELASLVALADELRDEVAGLELDPAVTEKHLNLVYRRRQAPAPTRDSRRQHLELAWRRRFVSIAFAAILLLVPASLASGSAMPGDPLYPLKRGLEQVRIVAALSPGADAETRTSIADVRLEELEGLLQAGEFGRVPEALVALQHAVADAEQAVRAARSRGADSSEVAALESRLDALQDVQAMAVAKALSGLPEATRNSIIEEIKKTATTLKSSGTTGSTVGTTSSTSGPTTTACVVERGESEDKCLTGVSSTTTSSTTGPTTSTSGVTTTSEPPATTSTETTAGRPGGSTGTDASPTSDPSLLSTLIDAVTP
jgi:Domain of unknown function (DUF5667)